MDSLPLTAPAPSNPAPVSSSKQSAPWAPILAPLRALSIYHLTLVLVLLAALAGLWDFPPGSRLSALFTLVLAAAVCAGADALLLFQSKRVWKLSENSLISGLLIGSILAPETSPFLVAAIAILSVLLKRLLHEGPFPVFNPAAAALALGGILFGTLDAWWAFVPSGPGLLILVLAILLLSWKQNRWQMELVFLLAWLAAWALFLRLPPLAPGLAGLNALLGLLPLYLMAFMLLEPKTSPLRPKQQCIYGAIAALVAVFLLPLSTATDMALVGLLIANLAKKAMEKLKFGI